MVWRMMANLYPDEIVANLYNGDMFGRWDMAGLFHQFWNLLAFFSIYKVLFVTNLFITT